MGLVIQDVEALKLLVKSLLDRDIRISLDASALVKQVLQVVNGKDVILTPHTGEFKRLFGVEVPNEKRSRISITEEYAKKNSITILLKGHDDIITDGKNTFINSKNTPAMTVGGTGDVLSGIVASILSRNRNTIESAASGAFLNALAGKSVQKQFGLHMLATDLIEALPHVSKTFDKIK